MMDFLQKKKIYQNGKSSKFVVEIVWNSEIYQNDHHLVLLKKLKGVLEKKLDFFKTSKCINYSVECDRISKTSQNKIWVFFQKKKVSLIEKLIVFKNNECCKLPVEFGSDSTVSQNIQNLRFLKKIHGFSQKKA